MNGLFDIKHISYEEGYKSLSEALKALGIPGEKQYLFIQTWDSITTNGPRLGYTLYLDSLFARPEYEAMDKVLISEMRDEDMRDFMRDHRIALKAFTTVNEADDYISAVFTLQKAKAKSHPLQLIINRKGEILYCNASVSGMEERDSTIYKTRKILGL